MHDRLGLPNRFCPFWLDGMQGEESEERKNDGLFSCSLGCGETY